jgi:hypothetical protein
MLNKAHFLHLGKLLVLASTQDEPGLKGGVVSRRKAGTVVAVGWAVAELRAALRKQGPRSG